MAFNLDSLASGTVARPPRIILLGTEKIGKSSFASMADRPVFIPVAGEEGIDDISCHKWPTCQSLSDVMECLHTLLNTEHNLGTVVIDSASALEPLVWADTCLRWGNAESIEKCGGGYGKGYMDAINDWRRITSYLDALRTYKNMAAILIGHVIARTFSDPTGDSYNRYEFDINGKAANMLFRWADSILFCNNRTSVRKEDAGFGKEEKKGVDITGNRYLYTQSRPAHPGGGRGACGRLPYELPLSWQAYQDAILAATQATQ